MQQQVYAFDPSVNAYRHIYVDHGPAKVAVIAGAKITPISARPTDNCGRKRGV